MPTYFYNMTDAEQAAWVQDGVLDRAALPAKGIHPTKILGQSLKVDRYCPRCRFHAYHSVVKMFVRDRGRGRNALINCVDCGHEWAGRLQREEIE